MFLIRFEVAKTGVLIDSRILIIPLTFGGNTRQRNELYVDLDALSWVLHLLHLFGDVLLLRLFSLEVSLPPHYPEQAAWRPGISVSPELCPRIPAGPAAGCAFGHLISVSALAPCGLLGDYAADAIGRLRTLLFHRSVPTRNRYTNVLCCISATPLIRQISARTSLGIAYTSYPVLCFSCKDGHFLSVKLVVVNQFYRLCLILAPFFRYCPICIVLLQKCRAFQGVSACFIGCIMIK